MHDSIHTLEDVRKEKELRKNIENLVTKEEIKWAQKARSDWIIQGDRNKKYFQTVVKQRRDKNRIVNLRQDNGTLTENLEEIKRILVSHFKDRFIEIDPKSVRWILGVLESLPIPKLNHQ